MSAPRSQPPNAGARRPTLALTTGLAMLAAVASLLAADEEPVAPLPPPDVVPVEIPFQPGQEPGDGNGPAFDIVVPAPGDFGLGPSEPDTNANESNAPAGAPGADGRFPAAGGNSSRPGGFAAPASGEPTRRPVSGAPPETVTRQTEALEPGNAPARRPTNGPAASATNPPAATADPHTGPESSPPENASNRLDYSRFKLIADRNIFDPNRYPQMTRRQNREPNRPRTVESFSLVGIMIYAKGPFAFFDGSSPSYRKVLKPSDTIAGYEITNVTPDKVQLATNGKTIDLQVGMQMRREEEGTWTLGGPAQPYASSAENPPSASTASAPGSTSSATAGGSGGDESEILKRLLQKREQELNK